MAKQPFISHVVNGYSRYDVPESKAFSCTPGILYPARIDFINARDRVRIAQGIDVRSNPLTVPTFNPYTVRLHRFWVPLQLYHPEMRTNASDFDMRNLSLNWIPNYSNSQNTSISHAYPNSLLHWLRIAQGLVINRNYNDPPTDVSLPSSSTRFAWSNADTYLAYWDIVRNYYSYSQWSVFSFASPASWIPVARDLPSLDESGVFSDGEISAFRYADSARYFFQTVGNLRFLDAYFESQFYPSSVPSDNNTYNRSNLYSAILFSDIRTPLAGVAVSDGYPVTKVYPSTEVLSNYPNSQFATQAPSSPVGGCLLDAFLTAHPMAVVPSSPDRFSRLLPPFDSDNSVPMSSITTIPQLAIASRLQEYKDLLGAGDNRFSGWLETFFASKIEHVDRPKLLFSASQTVNAQVIMNQSGSVSENGTSGGALGQMGGSISFNTTLGRPQSYYFREPGYMIDLISIRPVYYWSGAKPDYLSYLGSDYFNPIYNDIGYQGVPLYRLGWFPAGGQSAVSQLFREPCFNEFRSSYDEVLGQLSANLNTTVYSSWVQQRSVVQFSGTASDRWKLASPMFTDLATVNLPFASDVEDNFFVNLSYAVRKKSLINKTFATRLSNR